MKNILFPKIRIQLLELVNEEQDELTRVFTNGSNKEIKLHRAMINCHKRADKVIKILNKIKLPTTENIGEDGSEAVCTLVMHSYLSLMKSTLKSYNQIYEINPNNIHIQSIPALTDRIMILESKKQLYGTQWMLSDKGVPFLIEVTEFESVNVRRKKYGLNKLERPKDLTKSAIENPLGQGEVYASHMKRLSENEYKLYSKYYLKKIV